LALGAVAVAAYLYVKGQRPAQPRLAADRIPKLTALVAEQERESAEAVEASRPDVSFRADDLSSPVAVPR
jgi:hypothetical protein